MEKAFSVQPLPRKSSRACQQRKHISNLDNSWHMSDSACCPKRPFVTLSFKGGGGGGGVHPDYFVKLDFEIAVDQQTRTRDRTFEGVPDSG